MQLSFEPAFAGRVPPHGLRLGRSLSRHQWKIGPLRKKCWLKTGIAATRARQGTHLIPQKERHEGLFKINVTLRSKVPIAVVGVAQIEGQSLAWAPGVVLKLPLRPYVWRLGNSNPRLMEQALNFTLWINPFDRARVGDGLPDVAYPGKPGGDALNA